MSSIKRFVAVADSHGHLIDNVTRKALLDFVSDYKPSIRLHLGDMFDFSPLRKGASEEERAQSLEEDYLAAEDFLADYFKGGKHNVALFGNHDARLFELEHSSNGVLRDYAKANTSRVLKILGQHKAATLPYDSRKGIYRLGDLNCLHGYFAGKSAAINHARVYGNCIYGHTHTIESAAVENLEQPSTANGIGCLCTVDMNYNSRMPNKLRQSNGWFAGVIYPNGTTSTFQVKRTGNKFLCASDFKIY
jgi:predicted phosphodiesterase